MDHPYPGRMACDDILETLDEIVALTIILLNYTESEFLFEDESLPSMGLIGDGLAMKKLKLRLWRLVQYLTRVDLIRVDRRVEDRKNMPEIILLHGEMGTGKSRIARCLYDFGPRARQGKFVEVSCPVKYSEAFRAQLFGWNQGAFTGAVRDFKGFLGEARGGTLFVLEVDLSRNQKASLELVRRALDIPSDKRMQSSANHMEIAQMIQSGFFREFKQQILQPLSDEWLMRRLQEHGGKVTATAKAIGTSRQTIYAAMERVRQRRDRNGP